MKAVLIIINCQIANYVLIIFALNAMQIIIYTVKNASLNAQIVILNFFN